MILVLMLELEFEVGIGWSEVGVEFGMGWGRVGTWMPYKQIRLNKLPNIYVFILIILFLNIFFYYFFIDQPKFISKIHYLIGLT